MLDRKFVRRIRLLKGREELITFRYTMDNKEGLVEHVTMEVPDSFLERPLTTTECEPKKGM